MGDIWVFFMALSSTLHGSTYETLEKPSVFSEGFEQNLIKLLKMSISLLTVWADYEFEFLKKCIIKKTPNK